MYATLIRSIKPTRRELLTLVVVVLMLVLMVGAAFASTPTPVPTATGIPTLTVDPSPLFASVSTYVPMFFGILAVAGGILIGKRIAEYIIKAIADAF